MKTKPVCYRLNGDVFTRVPKFLLMLCWIISWNSPSSSIGFSCETTPKNSMPNALLDSTSSYPFVEFINSKNFRAIYNSRKKMEEELNIELLIAYHRGYFRLLAGPFRFRKEAVAYGIKSQRGFRLLTVERLYLYPYWRGTPTKRLKFQSAHSKP